ncbi:MAG: UDP-N-acetylmuramoylalanine--D-glutamate ligase [Acetobacteraceae bacterium]|nr:UDP-N-acetylmuramoylalanine--D-glutamate ligase [Acetobacteraceae bacterium]
MSSFSPTLFSGKRFAVVGLGKNGLPAALGLRAMGADVVAWDDNSATRTATLEAVARMSRSGIPADSGGSGDALF